MSGHETFEVFLESEVDRLDIARLGSDAVLAERGLRWLNKIELTHNSFVDEKLAEGLPEESTQFEELRIIARAIDSHRQDIMTLESQSNSTAEMLANLSKPLPQDWESNPERDYLGFIYYCRVFELHDPTKFPVPELEARAPLRVTPHLAGD